MKKTMLLLLAFAAVGNLHAQDRYTDSLRTAFYRPASDSDKIKSAILLSSKMSHPDSSLLWAEKALVLAKQSEWEKGQVKAHDQVASVFLKVSNYPRALEHLFPALELTRATNDHEECISILRKIGRVYARQSDYPNALNYYYEAIGISRAAKLDERNIYFQVGAAYDHTDKLDSALFYYQRAYEYISTKGDRTGLAGVLSHLGALHAKMKNYPLALSYGRMAVTAFETYNHNEAGSAYRHLADIFINLNMRDSALFYAHKNLAHGERIGSKDMQLEGAELLAELYNDINAVKYYRIASGLRDSIFSKEKAAAIANLSFNHRQREKEIEAEKEKLAHERRMDIQYGGIAIGLLIFALLYLVYTHSIMAKEKAVRFIGVLSLLMVFEFINLVIHPYVGSFTHHSPLWMLLIMVTIAALLIPLHHKIEKEVVSRMVERNKKIRLAAAKKTIAKLEGTMLKEEEVGH